MLLTVIAGVVVLGLMVLVHEFGHFLVAKLFGIRVDVFSIGFGPRLFGSRRGATDYRVSALPLGGYVKMAGDTLEEEPSGAPDEFLSKPRWQRALVVLAGPAMNLLLAVFLLALVFTYRYERPAFLEAPAVIGGVVPDSPAAAAGLRAGDRIVTLEGFREPPWQEVLAQTAISAGQVLHVTVARGGEVLSVALTPHEEGRWRLGVAGWLPYDPPVIGNVMEGSPAARAGLQAGDILLAMNGELLHDLSAVPERVQKLSGAQAQFRIERSGSQRTVTIEPAWDAQEERWRLGVGLATRMITARLSPPEALGKSVQHNWQTSAWIVTLVGRLLTGRAKLRSLEGPVGIVRHSGEAARQGWVALVNLMVTISLSLGLLNLLPIPILDGGHLLLLAVESSFRRDLSLALKERVMQAGFVFLMLVFAVVMYNDLARLVRDFLAART